MFATFAGGYSRKPLPGLPDEPAIATRRAEVARSFATALNAEIRALADAGCPFVEIDEPVALTFGDDRAEWRAFHAAHERLLDGVADGPAHLSLGLWGGQI